MGKRNIRIFGDEILRKKAKEVKAFNKSLHTLLDDMAETMYEAKGVGLAAPQVGILKRAVVIDIGEGLVELVNPRIVETKGEQINEEGCLSLPGEASSVSRPMFTKVVAYDRNGNEFTIEGEGLISICLNHEIDHLEGILYTDKAIEDMENIEETEVL